MKYENKSMTSDGEKLLAQSVANKQAPVIDKMLVLNTGIPLEKTIDSLTLNDFSNAISFDVNNVSQNDNSFTASAVISNNEINQDYTAKLIGITGFLNGSDDRKLFSVAQGSDPFVIEKQDGTPVTLVPSITTGFSNSENVQLTVKNDVYVTHDEIETLKADIAHNISGPDSTVSKNIAQSKTDANNYTDSVKDGLQKNIDTTNQRIDKAQDQLGADIRDAEQQFNSYADSAKDLAISTIQSQLNNMYQDRGSWYGPLNDWGDKKDGYYTVHAVHDGAPDGFTGWGVIDIKSGDDGADKYGSLHDSNNHIFINHLFVRASYFSGWQAN
ncbi:hypothetical protein [Apilactobacillus timberlakei]|uniref:hypothetical protein n=1 Tax=Apilactobacillus timberlakei TaxID=2008380 RepID=UPI00112B3CB4|nr:hypothetical protein [Apilactobacillus timberlakei]TPR12240.1 hypothetical protein DYZ97_07100 [Apilactobacillus timberlakei]